MVRHRTHLHLVFTSVSPAHRSVLCSMRGATCTSAGLGRVRLSGCGCWCDEVRPRHSRAANQGSNSHIIKEVIDTIQDLCAVALDVKGFCGHFNALKCWFCTAQVDWLLLKCSQHVPSCNEAHFDNNPIPTKNTSLYVNGGCTDTEKWEYPRGAYALLMKD